MPTPVAGKVGGSEDPELPEARLRCRHGWRELDGSTGMEKLDESTSGRSERLWGLRNQS